MATEALAAHRGEGVTATLLDFVDRVAAERSGSGGGDGSGGQPSGGGGAVIGLLIAGVVAFLVFRAVRKRRRSQAELAEVKAAAHEDLIALADDVQKLEQPVEANAQAKQEYTQALDFYDQASGAYDRVTQPRQLEAVTSALEEGRWHMSAAEALLEGRNPPERRPPCFFDPRHGPSARDVEWTPPGGTPRKVPACEADAQAVERGTQPASREVMAGGRMVPTGAPRRTSARGRVATSCRSAGRGSSRASSSASCWAARSAVGATAAGAARARPADSATGTMAAEAEAVAATSAAGMSFGGGDFGGGGNGEEEAATSRPASATLRQ